MKKLKKLLAPLLVVLMLCGCAANDVPAADTDEAANPGAAEETVTENGEDIELTMWFWGATPEQQEVMQTALIDRFEAENPGYKLVVEYRSSVNNDVRVAISADQGPDILYESSPGLAGTYIEAGKYADLSEYAEQYGWKDRLLSAAYDSCTFNDKLYLVPMGINLVGMYYDAKNLADNGWEVPETIEDVEAIMDDAMSKGMYASLNGNATWRANNEDYVTMFLNNWAGPEEVYKALTGEQDWASPRLIEAVEKCGEWYQKGYLCKDYLALGRNEALQMMADGQSPFHFGASKSYQFAAPFYTDDRAGDLKFMALPAGNSGVESNYAMGCTGVLGINEASEHKDICAKFLDMLMTTETVAELSKDWTGYWYVPLKNLGEIDASSWGEYAKSAMESIQAAVEQINSGNFGYFSSSVMPPATLEEFINIETVWYGETDAESFMKHVDEIFDDEEAKGLVPPIPALG